MLKHHRDLLAILLILAVALPLLAIGIGWGLPNHYSYAPDAISPLRAADALRSYFDSDRVWADKYPPGHYYLVGLLCEPLLAWCRSGPEGDRFAAAVAEAIEGSTQPGWARVENHARYLKTFMSYRGQMTLLILAGRSLSLVMALGAVLLLYGIGRRLGGIATGLTAALVAVSYAPTIFHSHTMNVDMPYIFWLALAYYLLLRTIQSGRARSALFAGAAAAMAVATKDQAYGVLIAAPVLFLVFWWRPMLLGPRPGRGFRSANAVGDGPTAADPMAPPASPRGAAPGSGRPFPFACVGLALLGFGLVFVLANNLVFQWAGYRDHLHYIFGQGSQPYRTHESSPAGQIRLFGHSIGLLFETMPWLGIPYIGAVPLVVGTAIGLVLRPARTLFGLLPPLSYYFGFVAPIGYCYARFLIPVVFFLSLPAGLLFRDLLELGRASARRWGERSGGTARGPLLLGLVVILLVLVPMVGGGARSLQALLDDPRDRATTWLQEHLEPGAVVLTYADKLFTGPKMPDGVPFEIVVVNRISAAETKLVVVGRGDPSCLKDIPIAYLVSSSFHPSYVRTPPQVGGEQRIFGLKTRVAAVFSRSFKHSILDQIRINPTVVIYAVVP